MPKEDVKILETPDGPKYIVGTPQGVGDCFTCYSGADSKSGRPVLIKVAKVDPAQQADFNERLFNEAGVLNLLHNEASRLEKLHKQACETNGVAYKPLNYSFLFAVPLHSFGAASQKGRTVNVLGFASEGIEKLEQLMILSEIGSERRKFRIDAMSVGWLGKGFKAMSLAHEAHISLGRFDLLLETDKLHLPIIFHLDKAEAMTAEDFTPDIPVREIQAYTRMIVQALGGDVSTGELVLPPDPTLPEWPDRRFVELLGLLLHGQIISAIDAHTVWYELVRKMWGNEWHKFTTYPLE